LINLERCAQDASFDALNRDASFSAVLPALDLASGDFPGVDQRFNAIMGEAMTDSVHAIP
jgi:hypothetical protein